MKHLKITKFVIEINAEGVWGELESQKGLQRQSIIKYLRLTLVFMEIVHYDLFASINKTFILAGRRGTRL